MLLAGVVTTVVLRSASRSKRRSASLWEVDTVTHDDRRPLVSDHATVARAYGLIGKREIGWLRSETFAASWLDGEVVFLRELARFDSRHSYIVDPGLAAAVARLIAAAEAFIHVYDHSTVADPIMRDSRWRVVGCAGPDATTDGLADDDRIASESRLREAAAEVVASYTVFSAAAQAGFPLA